MVFIAKLLFGLNHMNYLEIKLGDIVRGKQFGKSFQGKVWELDWNYHYGVLEARIATETEVEVFHFDPVTRLPITGHIEKV